MVYPRKMLWLLAVLVCQATGCVDGPFGGFATVNPWIQKNWVHDEKFGPTFHRRLTDLRGLKSTVARLDSQKREELVRDMTRLYPIEPNPVLRAEMALILGELAIPSAMSPLQTALGDADKDVRMAACRAWGRFGADTAIPVLSDMMDREKDIDVRMALIRELGRFPDPAAVAVLGQALDDDNPAAQHLAVQSLKTASGRDFGDSVPAWREFVQGREPAVPAGPSVVERLTNLF